MIPDEWEHARSRTQILIDDATNAAMHQIMESSRKKGKDHYVERSEPDEDYDMENFISNPPTFDASTPYDTDNGLPQRNLPKGPTFGNFPGMITSPRYRKEISIEKLLIPKDELPYPEKWAPQVILLYLGEQGIETNVATECLNMMESLLSETSIHA
ncbi:MAG: hypothetical protein M1840_005348 [Geoglossum simile]|nr:MAG: hypothetical protein M1840_005348 [Geoglossum simile]